MTPERLAQRRAFTREWMRSQPPEYRAWENMKKRCYYPMQDGYERYGGRGIRVSSRWLASFSNFYEDMGPKPTPQHQLDRIDNNGHYQLGNCQWATPTENNRKKSNISMDWEKVGLIRSLFSTGKSSRKQLAVRFGLSSNGLNQIISNVRWNDPSYVYKK